jgi:hypothetical protein
MIKTNKMSIKIKYELRIMVYQGNIKILRFEYNKLEDAMDAYFCFIKKNTHSYDKYYIMKVFHKMGDPSMYVVSTDLRNETVIYLRQIIRGGKWEWESRGGLLEECIKKEEESRLRYQKIFKRKHVNKVVSRDDLNEYEEIDTNMNSK